MCVLGGWLGRPLRLLCDSAKLGDVLGHGGGSDSQMQDFDTRNYNGVGNSKSFEFAPAGHVSGFCVADHTGQTGEGLELVTCNFGPGQTFTPNQDPNDSDVYAWVSGRDSQNVITDPGDGGRGTRLRMELNGTYDDQELEWTSTV